MGKVLLAIMVVVCCADLIRAIVKHYNFKKYKGDTIGAIISIRKHCKRDRFLKNYVYYAAYRYIVDGITYEEEFPLYENNEKLLHLYQRTKIHYDENNPRNFFPIDKKNAWRTIALNDLLYLFSMFLILEFMKYR